MQALETHGMTEAREECQVSMKLVRTRITNSRSAPSCTTDLGRVGSNRIQFEETRESSRHFCSKNLSYARHIDVGVRKTKIKRSYCSELGIADDAITLRVARCEGIPSPRVRESATFEHAARSMHARVYDPVVVILRLMIMAAQVHVA